MDLSALGEVIISVLLKLVHLIFLIRKLLLNFLVKLLNLDMGWNVLLVINGRDRLEFLYEILHGFFLFLFTLGSSRKFHSLTEMRLVWLGSNFLLFNVILIGLLDLWETLCAFLFEILLELLHLIEFCLEVVFNLCSFVVAGASFLNYVCNICSRVQSF